MIVYVLICEYDREDGTRCSGVYGVYSSRESVGRAADKFIALSKEDEEFIARSTTISHQTIDHGWFEDFWTKDDPVIEYVE